MNSTEDFDPKERLVYDATLRQLERMRSMQYAYHQKFFAWILGSGLVFLVLLLWPAPYAGALVPFLVVTAGMQAAFYLHFCDFARVHARHLEDKLNVMLGRRVLLAAELEQIYFYPMDEPKLAGLLPGHPLRFFSMFTLHWLVVWVAAAFFGFMKSWEFLAVHGWTGGWLAAAIVWAGLNVAYLAWFFLGRRYEARIDRHLGTQLYRSLP